MASISEHSVIIRIIDQASKAVKGIEKSVEGMLGKIEKHKEGIQSVGTIAGMAFAGLGFGVKNAVSTFGDFEEKMSGVQAVLNPTAEEMKALTIQAEKLGASTKFSALETADATEVLAKNGLNTKQILDGALESTLNLAAATGTNIATAADIATDAMASFKLTTEDLDRVMNSITGTTNASKFSIEEYKYALAAGGGVASALGVELEDFNAVIAATSSRFAGGSDAGTSFKTFMQRLVPASKEAKGAMKDLGIVAFSNKKAFDELTNFGVKPASDSFEDIMRAAERYTKSMKMTKKQTEAFFEELGNENQFYTAEGNLKSMAEVSEILKNTTKELSEEQKNQYLTTIFGSDALRTASGLAEVGAEKFRELSTTIESTDTGENAKIRMNNLKGTFEELGGAVDSVKIALGRSLAPVIKQITIAFTEIAQKVGEWSAENPDLAHAVAFTNSLNNAGKVDFENDQMRMSDEIIKNWYTDLQNDERKSLLSNALSSDVNIANAMEETKRKADKLTELQKSVLTIDEEVDKELEGKNVSRSYAQTLKAKRGSTIHTAIASAQIDYSNAMNYQRDLIENKKYDIDYQRQLENRKFQVGQNIFMGRENVALGLQKAQAEFEQKIRQDDMVRNNPRLATQAMIDSYRKQGINAMRSDAEIIADIEQKVASGQSLGEALTELNKAFQSKEEYKTLQRLHNGRLSDMEKVQAEQQNMALGHKYSMATLAQKNAYDVENLLMNYNLKTSSDREKAVIDMVNNGVDPAVANAHIRSATGNWKGATGQELLFAPEGTRIPTRLAQVTSKNPGGKECAEWVNDITGIGLGSSWESKVEKIDSDRGEIGSVAIWQPAKTGEYAKYGHAGIIVGQDEKGNWLIKSSNYKGDGRISIDAVPPSKIAGYRSTHLGSKIMQAEGIGKNKSGDGEITDKQFMQYNQIQNRFSSNAQVKAFEETYSQGMNILSSLADDSGAGDMAGIFSFMKSLDPSSVVRESEFEMAAKSAGVVENAKNIFQKLQTGEILSENQRVVFKKIAKQFVENKARIYETHYNDTIRIMGNQGIPESYYPTNMAEEMRQTIGKSNDGQQVHENQNPYMNLYNSLMKTVGL